MPPRSRALRLAAAGAAAALVLTTAACAQTIAGTGNRLGAAPGGAGANPVAGSPGAAASIADLSGQLILGASKGTTVHTSMTYAGPGGGDVDSTSFEGDLRTKDGGTVDALHYEISVASETIEMIFVDGTAYVKLPESARPIPGKPWTKISADSSDPEVAAIATQFAELSNQSSLSGYADLVRSSSNFAATGAARVGGVDTQGYSFDVDPSKVPNLQQLGAEIAKIGTIPVTLAVDGQGRPVQLTEELSIEGVSLTITIAFTDYGKPVTIAAPPADQTDG